MHLSIYFKKIELESPSGEERSAKELCANLISFVVNKTREKREILENAEISDRQKRYLQSKMKPGKLDHATVAAYEVGHFRPEPLKLTFQGKSAVIPVENSEVTPLFCLLK